MPSFIPRWSQVRKGAGILTASAFAASVGSYYIHQSRQRVHGNCEFSEHMRKEHQKHLFSGMHKPFVTQDQHSLALFRSHFGQFSHLLPKSAEELGERQALKTPVNIRPMKECPVSFQKNTPSTALVAVGGPPALITAVAQLGKGMEIIYINDERRWPISNGSAWHIEEDSDAEAPTTYSPGAFMKNQILRAVINRESYEQIERTGLYPWRTLDWGGFAKHPEQWLPALSVAIEFQRKNTRGAHFRQEEVAKVVERCQFNDRFFNQLNGRLGGKLFLSGMGSIIVARNPSEQQDLITQNQNLEKEGRRLIFLTSEDLIKRFGFSLQGIAFAEKPHDRVLSPNFKQILGGHIIQQGGKVIDGTLVTIYTDDQNSGGIARYRTPNGEEHYQPFGQLAVSLGNQAILDHSHKPLFNAISATGSSGLALVYTPINYKLPRVSIFGGTNHVAVLSNDPVPVMHEGTAMHLNLIRFTAGACVTPAYRGKEGGYYDSTISLGLVNSVYKTLGEHCKVIPLTVYGCNRVVSKNGQTDWIQPYPGIYVQYGAGGGGLTRAPDLVASLSLDQRKLTPRPRPN